MAKVTEIAEDVFRISTFVPEVNLSFNQFLVRDEEPLLYHTGMRGLFPIVRDAVRTLIDPADLRWVAFSHFEADECGSLREWQELAPVADAVCTTVGKLVSVDDVVAARPARTLSEGEVLTTGKRQFRFLQTPHVPHAWDASLLFEETTETLFCSDLFHQGGEVEAVTDSDIVPRFRATLEEYQAGPFANYMPYATLTEATLARLAELRPRVLAAMHGSTFLGDGEKAIYDLASVMRQVLAPA